MMPDIRHRERRRHIAEAVSIDRAAAEFAVKWPYSLRLQVFGMWAYSRRSVIGIPLYKFLDEDCWGRYEIERVTSTIGFEHEDDFKAFIKIFGAIAAEGTLART